MGATEGMPRACVERRRKRVEIRNIEKDTWALEEEGVRFFLLAGTERAMLVDSGMTSPNARALAETLVEVPVELLLTHADRDHVSGSGSFAWFFMHPAEASNFYNTQGLTGEFRPVEEGDVLDLGDRPLEIWSIPGHTPGSIAVLDRKNRALLSGDTVQDGRIFLFGVQREIRAYQRSLEKLERRSDRFDVIWPCHGSLPVRPDQIGKLRRAAAAIQAGMADSVEDSFFGTPLRRFEMGCATFLRDR